MCCRPCTFSPRVIIPERPEKGNCFQSRWNHCQLCQCVMRVNCFPPPENHGAGSVFCFSVNQRSVPSGRYFLLHAVQTYRCAFVRRADSCCPWLMSRVMCRYGTSCLLMCSLKLPKEGMMDRTDQHKTGGSFRWENFVFYAGGGYGDVSPAFITRTAKCKCTSFNHITRKHTCTRSQCIFVHLRGRKVAIWWTKMDGLIFHGCLKAHPPNFYSTQLL